jgi:hypothetical protein
VHANDVLVSVTAPRPPHAVVFDDMRVRNDHRPALPKALHNLGRATRQRYQGVGPGNEDIKVCS